ncbi:MAG: hypothetical protein SGPRY_000589 [Prymnesium sp.]
MSQFEATTLAGQEPRGTNIYNWPGIVKKCFTLAKVYVSPDLVRQVLECEANPLNLMYVPWLHRLPSKGYMHTRASRNYAQLRIPPEEKPRKNNLKYLCSKLYGKSGRKTNRRPWKACGGLQRDNDPQADEDDQVNENRNKWW